MRWTTDGIGGIGEESPADLQEQTIEIGSSLAEEDSKRFVSRSGFGYTGSIWSSSVEKLVENSLDDLL